MAEQHNHPDLYQCRWCPAVMPGESLSKHVLVEHPRQYSLRVLRKLREKLDEHRDVLPDEAIARMATEMREAADLFVRTVNDETDTMSVHSIDETIGSASVHWFYLDTENCGAPKCQHNEFDPGVVDAVIERMNKEAAKK